MRPNPTATFWALCSGLVLTLPHRAYVLQQLKIVSKLCLIPLFRYQQSFPASHRVSRGPRIYACGGAHKHTHARKHARSFTLSTAARVIWVCCVYIKWVSVSGVGRQQDQAHTDASRGGGASRGQATFKLPDTRVVDNQMLWWMKPTDILAIETKSFECSCAGWWL